MQLKHFFLLLTLMLSQLFIKAQLQGKVIEVNSSKDTTVLPGVIIHWLNSTSAAITDANGDFKIKIEKPENKLIIQATGYQSDTLVVSNFEKTILIKLNNHNALQEVEVIYYSSGTEISYLNPIKTEILNERSLMKAACCNLSESFETNPSVDVNFVDAVSGTKQIQMLGLSGQYAQITKENMPYLRGLANNFGLTFIPGTWIKSIQLSKGAGSVVNGYESFTGQINTELHNPSDADRLNFNFYVNENARNEYNLILTHKLNSKLSTSLFSHYSSNPLVQDLNKDGFADIPIGEQYNFLNKYDFRHKQLESQTSFSYLKDSRIGGQFAKIVKNYSDTLPLYKVWINNQKWEVNNKTGFVFRKKAATSFGLQSSYLNHDQNISFGLKSYSGSQKTLYENFIFQGIINNTNNVYKFGFSFLNDEVKEKFQQNSYSRIESALGTFVEFTKNYKEKFNMIIGLRADYHNYYGLFYTPRLHLRYAFTEKTILRFSGGRALKTANIFTDNTYLMASSRTWMIEKSNTKNPYGLNPEIGYNYGFNFTQKFKLNYRDAYVTLDAYRTDFIQQVVTDLDYNAQQVVIFNLKGPSYSNTFQFEFNCEPRKRLFIKTAYRYVDTKVNFKTGLFQKAMVSKHRAFINFSYETKNKHWQFDFTTQFNGAKRLPNTETNPTIYQLDKYSPNFYNVLSQITYQTKFNRNDFNCYIGVENLLNYKQTNPIVASDAPYSKHFDASMVWGPIYGRMMYVGFRLKLK